MAYKAGMARFEKSADGYYRPARDGSFYKGNDGKMYAMTKADYNFGNDDDDDDDAMSKKAKKAKKSEITVDDFQKSLDELEALAKAGDSMSRKEELLQKSLRGEDLSKDEADYLYKSLGGEVAVDDDPQIHDEITKGFTDPEEGLQKALDVSEYLESHNSALIDSLSAVRDALEKSDSRQHDFNLVLAKAVYQSGELIKSMAERIGVLESQPAYAPKSRGVGQPARGQTLEKGFAGAGPGGEQLSKGEILDTLSDMMAKSDPNGSFANQVLHESAKYEQTNQLSKAMLDKVMEFRATNAH